MELAEKVKVYKGIAAEHGRPATLALMRDVHIAERRDQLDPHFLPNVIKVWQSYDDIGSKADRDPLAEEVMFGGKQVTLDEFAPNRAVVGNPDDCNKEMQRIKEIIDPEWFFITPTGVPDPEQQIRELRLFAKEVMPHFH